MIDGECQTFVSDCHVRMATELIGHAWDPVILAALRAGPIRRAELLRTAQMSDKVLSEALRRLCARGLVEKTNGGGGVSYGLTPLGESFANGPLRQMAEWAAAHQTELAATS